MNIVKSWFDEVSQKPTKIYPRITSFPLKSLSTILQSSIAPDETHSFTLIIDY